MDIDEYEDIPDGLSKTELSTFLNIFFQEIQTEQIENSLKKLDILCDKQWHTYELPDEEVKEKIRKLLLDNLDTSDEYLELVLSTCYCFGLDKKIFSDVLDKYHGWARNEFIEILEKSKGDNIDPYWSLRT